MASNYVQFSIGLKCSKEEHISLTDICDIAENLYDMEEHKAKCLLGLHPEYEAFSEDWVTGLEVVREGDTTYVYTEESSCPGGTGEILRIWLSRHYPKKAISFTYATTSSKMRPGEFGGGAVFVTAREVQVKDAISIFQKEEEDFGKDML